MSSIDGIENAGLHQSNKIACLSMSGAVRRHYRGACYSFRSVWERPRQKSDSQPHTLETQEQKLGNASQRPSGASGESRFCVSKWHIEK
jgi:hypothetical protein